MKKITLLSITALLFSTSSTYAQPKKGDWMVGANIINSNAHITRARSQFSVNVNPSAGYFLSNRIVVGSTLGLSYQRFGVRENAFSTKITPFARYYFSKKEGMKSKKIYLFGEVAVGAGVGTYRVISFPNDARHTDVYMLSNAGLGLSYFILPNVSVEGVFNVNYNRQFNNASPFNNNNISPSLGIGFQIYLLSKKAKSVNE